MQQEFGGIAQQASNFMPGTATLTAVAVAVGIAVGVKIAKNLRVVAKPNEVHIVQSSKTTVNYGKGYEAGNAYYSWPSWIPKIGREVMVLPLSIFDLDLRDYEAYDEQKVPFMVDVKAFFIIDKPSIAAERISNIRELQEQLGGILQGTVRTVLAKHNIEEILIERSTFGRMFTEETEQQLKEWGVINAKPIELMDVRDGKGSSTISNIMAKKESFIEAESRTEVAENMKNAQVAEIDNQRIADVQAQSAAQLVGQRTAQKEKEVGIANEQAKQAIQEQARETAEKDMNVFQVQVVRDAQIKKEAQIVKAEEVKQTNIISAQGIKEQQIINAEGQQQETIIIADGDLADEQRNAEAIQVVGQATAEAARLLEMARVSPELEMAREIGDNQGYQEYLVRIANVEKDKVVGQEQAKALQAADVKVISNSGDVSSGVDNVMDLFTSKGGANIGAAVEAAAQNPVAKAFIDKVTGTANGATQ